MFDSIVYWHWIVFGFILLTLEVFVPGAIFMWFGAGAIFVGSLLYLFPDIAVEWQILFFALVSISCLFAWKHFRKDNPADDTESGTLSRRGKALIGRKAPLVEAISNGVGRIQIDDTFWRVEGEDLGEGLLVRVVETEGATLKVEKVD